MAIPKIYKYGIEITKPWSSEMYDFNENIKEYYQDQIKDLINSLKTTEDCNFIAGIVNPYRYGIGTSDDIEYMKSDMIKNIENAESHWMKEVIEELLILQRIYPMICEATPEMPAISLYDLGIPMNIIGFETRDEILLLRKRYS
jgi:hypothetical protein